MDIRSGNDVRDLLTPRTHFKDEKWDCHENHHAFSHKDSEW
jgi:hypothetical protein